MRLSLSNIKNRSLRIKLLAPMVITFMICLGGLAVAIVGMQERLLSSIGHQIEQCLKDSAAQIGKQFLSLNNEVTEKLSSTAIKAGRILADATRRELQGQKKQIQAEWNKSLRETGKSMAQLLARVAPAAILSNNFIDLIAYVKSATQNPDVVFAVYLNKDRKPYTRYFDRRDDKIKQYLKTGEGRKKYEKILSAAVKDPDVFIVTEPITLDGSPLGYIMLGINKDSVQKKLIRLSGSFESLVARTTEKIHTVLENELTTVRDKMSKSLESVRKQNHRTMLKTSSELLAFSNKAKTMTQRTILIMGIVGGGMVLVISALMVVYMVIKPVEQVAVRLKDIAQGEGDLTARLEVKNLDEIGQLSKWFNLFMDKMQAIIRDIASNAETLNSTSETLTRLSGHMSEGADKMSQKSDTVAAAAEEMSSNLTSVADSMSMASGNVEQMAEATEQMTATIAEIARSSEKAKGVTSQAVAQSQNASTKVGELGGAAQKISKVTEVITEISEQTNLLALNATIEAARAGEAGKGFAVVANEIKDLARETAEATLEIKNQINDIQQLTGGTVQQIEQVAMVIDSVNEIVAGIASAVEEQAITTRAMSENIIETSKGIQEVNENVAQSSSVSTEIARDIAGVNDESRDISEGSSQVSNSAIQMRKLAAQLSELVGRFRY